MAQFWFEEADRHVWHLNGDTVEAVIRYDGPDHYAEHTAHLRAR